MSTIHTAVGPQSTADVAHAVFKTIWCAFEEKRRQRKLRATLYRLTDAELRDFGISHEAIEYIAANPGADPRYRGQ